VNLQTWLANGWLRPHQASAAEIRDLWLIAGRDLKDAESGGRPAEIFATESTEGSQRTRSQCIAR
jgi:hypothetical protein